MNRKTCRKVDILIIIVVVIDPNWRLIAPSDTIECVYCKRGKNKHVSVFCGINKSFTINISQLHPIVA